jgi:hypothetical protein
MGALHWSAGRGEPPRFPVRRTGVGRARVQVSRAMAGTRQEVDVRNRNGGVRPRRRPIAVCETGHPFSIFICIFICIFLFVSYFFCLSEPPRAPCARRTPFRNNSISSATAAPPIISTSDNPRSNAPVNWVELRCDDDSPGNLVVRYSGGGLRFTLYGLRSAVCGQRSTLPLQLRQ